MAAPLSVFPCKEYEPVEVPLEQLFRGSRVEIFPEVEGKGFFDIDYRAGRLVLTARSYVGLIPLSEGVAIHVLPRFPVADVLRLVHRATGKARFVSNFLRTYQAAQLDGDEPERLFASPLVDGLRTASRAGIPHRYLPHRLNKGYGGRVLMSATVSRFIARGDRTNVTHEKWFRTPSIPENQAIKETLTRIVAFMQMKGGEEHQQVRKTATLLLPYYDGVTPFTSKISSLVVALPQLIARLPTRHTSFAPVLWLCLLILGKKGVSLEAFGASQFHSLIVNMAQLFEEYVRKIVFRHIIELIPSVQVKNGNLEQVPLFKQGEVNQVQPDIYVVKDKQTLAVIDAKYKPTISASDRYEVLAFCEALQSKLAILVSPSNGETAEAFLGETPGGVRIFRMFFDISSVDLDAAEQRFCASLGRIILS